MRNFKYASWCLFLLLVATVTACKKPPVDSKVFVEKYLVGKWPLKLEIKKTLKNNQLTKGPDTTKFNPADTTTFTSDLKFTRKLTTINFEVDAAGENIKFNASPDSTWNINYLRTSSFKLVYTRKEQVGSDMIQYVIERDFSK